MGEQRRKSEDRQVELADAALRIIATKGIAALSTRSLAAEVGLSTGAIFKHFASLEALLDAVVGRVESVLEATFPDPGLPPLERLERFVAARSSAVGKQLGILRLVLSDQVSLAMTKGGSERLAACVARTRAFLRACIAEGQAQGTIRGDVPEAALTAVVMGTVQVLALANGKVKERELEAKAVREGLLTLLTPPRTEAAPRKKPS